MKDIEIFCLGILSGLFLLAIVCIAIPVIHRIASDINKPTSHNACSEESTSAYGDDWGVITIDFGGGG